MTLEQATKPEISSSGCEISRGMLRLLFSANHLSYDIGLVCSELSKAVNDAGVSSNPSGGATLDFDAKSGIRSEYEPAIGDIKAKIQSILGLPMLELQPNFERNFAAIAAYTASCQQSTTFQREWQKRLGQSTLKYF